MFYSPSTGGFYSADVHGENIPPDAAEISDDLHAQLMQGQSAGKRIATDEHGAPVLVDPPAPTTAELWSTHQAQAKALLEATSTTMERITEAVALGLNTFTGSDVLPWMTYRRALRSIVSQKTVGDPSQPLPTKPGAYPTGT